MADHAWTFPARFRSRAFGWKGSKLACQRIREAVTEIRSVRKRDPVLAAEGAVRFIERVVPAIQDIDSSSGSLGNAVRKALDALVEVIIRAPTDPIPRAAWLDRLWEATMDDGYGYLDDLPDRWGELCAGPELATRWADDLAPMLRRAWQEKGHLRGGTAALSCLLAAGRPTEVIDLLQLAPFPFWPDQRFAVQALVDLGRPDEAIRYAESRAGTHDLAAVARVCERILRDLGKLDEAYSRYALQAHQAGTRLATYRSLAKAYRDLPPEKLLADLVASTPGDEGKWFATAKELGFYDIAIQLANRTPCEPKTLIRAARDFELGEPLFALKAALTALRWLCEGWGYELDGSEVHSAFEYALRAAERIGQRTDALEAMTGLVDPERSGEAWVRGVLRRKIAAVVRRES